MKKNQPKIEVEKTNLQSMLDKLALFGLLGYILFVVMQWPGLPSEIPQHFDAMGNPDAYGSKNILLLLPVLAIGIYFLFTYINKRPHAFNYSVPITEENAPEHYALATTMMSGLNAVMIFIFFYLTWEITSLAKGAGGGLGTWFLPTVLAATFIPIVIYMWQAQKIKS